MNKQEAIAAMQSGKKVTHRYFTPDEWMTIKNGFIYLEDNVQCPIAEFFKYRASNDWEDGYSVLDLTVPTPQGDKTAEDAAISNLTDEFKADYIEACSDNRKLRKMLAEVTGLSRIATVEEYASHVKGQAEQKYTKEDLRTAFDGAEYFVDFDKWFDALSTPIKNNNMEQNTNDNEMSEMERHVRRLLDKHKKRDEYEKSSQEPNKNDYNMGFGHNEADRYKKDMEAHSAQSKEFTDALNFVLNYREIMEGMDGFIPSSDLAEMIVVYNQSRPQVDILANKKSIREMLEEYTILSGMEENTFSWNIDILSEMFYVEKINSKGHAGESVEDETQLMMWKEVFDELLNSGDIYSYDYAGTILKLTHKGYSVCKSK